MSPLDAVMEQARRRSARIGLIGQGDGSIEAAGADVVKRGLGSVTVFGPGGIEPTTDPRLPKAAQALRERWPERVRDGIHALDLAAHPLLFAAGLTAAGELDVVIGGTAVPIDAMEEAARWVMGPDRAIQCRGSLGSFATVDGRLVTLVMPDSAGPLDATGVARLALTAANHRGQAVGDKPVVGFLVPPPSQDASHADAELALAELRLLAPALSASVEWNWAPPGRDPGRFQSGPNVLIFPNQVAGHLAQVILRDAAGLRVWGPLFPGGTWTLGGVPDGADPSDIVAVIALAAAGTSAA